MSYSSSWSSSQNSNHVIHRERYSCHDIAHNVDFVRWENRIVPDLSFVQIVIQTLNDFLMCRKTFCIVTYDVHILINTNDTVMLSRKWDRGNFFLVQRLGGQVITSWDTMGYPKRVSHRLPGISRHLHSFWSKTIIFGRIFKVATSKEREMHNKFRKIGVIAVVHQHPWPIRSWSTNTNQRFAKFTP